MGKSIEEILEKLNKQRLEEKEKEEKLLKEKQELINKQKKWMEDSRRIFEAAASSAGAGAGAGGGGETIVRRNFRNQKYLSSQGNYDGGLTGKQIYSDGTYVKFFLPYLGDLNFNQDYSLVSNNYQMVYNFLNQNWNFKLDGSTIGSIPTPFSGEISADSGTFSFEPNNQSGVLCLSVTDGTLPVESKMILAPIFDPETLPEGDDKITFYYLGSNLDSLGLETILISRLAIDPDNNLGLSPSYSDGWLLVFAGPDGNSFTKDDSIAYYPGVGDDFPGNPTGTYSMLFQGASSSISGTYSIKSGLC